MPGLCGATDGLRHTIDVRTDLVASDIVIRGNRFTRNYRYGVIARPQQTGIRWDPTNVWFDTGESVIR